MNVLCMYHVESFEAFEKSTIAKSRQHSRSFESDIFVARHDRNVRLGHELELLTWIAVRH